MGKMVDVYRVTHLAREDTVGFERRANGRGVVYNLAKPVGENGQRV